MHLGKGLMREAIISVIDHLLTHTYIATITTTCRTDNPQPQCVLEKVGFQQVPHTTIRKHIKSTIVTLDTLVYEKH
jgi:RimJ/RimL family protein N-acetyltransferase